MHDEPRLPHLKRSLARRSLITLLTRTNFWNALTAIASFWPSSPIYSAQITRAKSTLIREAIQQNDALGVKQASHALKGALSNLAASQARQIAANLERLGASGNLAPATIVLGDLEREITRVVESLDALCQETIQ